MHSFLILCHQAGGMLRIEPCRQTRAEVLTLGIRERDLIWTQGCYRRNEKINGTLIYLVFSHGYYNADDGEGM